MSAAVLIIDDEAAICSSLSFALEDSFQVSTANSGAEALACLAEQEIGIVLLDLFLGDEDGIALIEKIKAVSASTTIIMMTAYGSIKTSVEAIRAGAFYYVTKPIDKMLQKAEGWQKTGAVEATVARLQMKIEQKLAERQAVRDLQAVVKAAEKPKAIEKLMEKGPEKAAPQNDHDDIVKRAERLAAREASERAPEKPVEKTKEQGGYER